jgi:hypothetical protein
LFGHAEIADEYDAAQKAAKCSGGAAKWGAARSMFPKRTSIRQVTDIGLTRKQVHVVSRVVLEGKSVHVMDAGS